MFYFLRSVKDKYTTKIFQPGEKMMMGDWEIGIMEYWNIGMMEGWNIGMTEIGNWKFKSGGVSIRQFLENFSTEFSRLMYTHPGKA